MNLGSVGAVTARGRPWRISRQHCGPQSRGGTAVGSAVRQAWLHPFLALWSEGRHLSLSLSFLGHNIMTISPSSEGYWVEYKSGNSYEALPGCQDYDEGSVTTTVIWVALGKMKQAGQWVTRVYACPHRGTSCHRLSSWETHCVQNTKSTGWGAQTPLGSKPCLTERGICVLLSEPWPSSGPHFSN